jgi:solute carrier family 35 protein C2
MTAAEFALLQRTSVVTLSIAGIFKEAVTISAAALVFGDTMTLVNVIGLFVTLFAIGAYNWIKINKMRREAQTDVRRGHLAADVVSTSPSNSGSGSDADADADADADEGEEAGLLRHSTDVTEDEVLFAADGADVIITPETSPTTSTSGRGRRLDRGD